MLKIIARIFIILAVAGVIGGGIYLLATSSLGQTALAGYGGGGSLDGRVGFASGASGLTNSTGTTSSFTQGTAPTFPGGSGDRDLHGDQAGLASIGKNLAIIALLTAAVVFFQKTIRLVFRHHPAASASA
jgi:hypothetical protein